MNAGDALAAALGKRGACSIREAREWPWASATFDGARHRLRLEMAARDADMFLGGIEDTEFDLPSHLLADLVVIEWTVAGKQAEICLEALTIRNVEPPLEPASFPAKAKPSPARQRRWLWARTFMGTEQQIRGDVRRCGR